MVERVPGGDPRTRADDRQPERTALLAELGVLAEDRAGDGRPASDDRPRAHDGRLHGAARTDHGAGADHRKAPDARPRADPRVLADVDGRHEPCLGVDLGGRGDEHEVATELVADLGAEPALEHVVLRLQVGVGRAHVEPVSRQREPVDGSLGAELREDLALDRDGATGRDQVEHARLEDVEARVDQVGVDLLGPRLLEERRDPAVGSEADEAVAARVGDGREQDRGLRPGRPVEGEQRVEIGLAQRVAVEGEERLPQVTCGEPDRAAGAEGRVLDLVVERELAVGVAEVLADLGRQVAARDDRRAARRAGAGARTCRRAAAGRRAAACPCACAPSTAAGGFPARPRG